MKWPNICEGSDLATQPASHRRNAIHHYPNVRPDLSVFTNLPASPADAYQRDDSLDPEKVRPQNASCIHGTNYTLCELIQVH